MKTFYSRLNLRHRVVRLVMLAASLFTLCVAAASVGLAQSTTPHAIFENSTLSGSGNAVNVTQLPVVKSDGTIVYLDLVVQFDVAGDGTPTVSAGFPQIVPSPQTIADRFRAGTYAGVDSGADVIIVSGPGVTPNGATVWSLAWVGGAGCATPYIATWYDVGTGINNSPIYGRLKGAGVTSTQFGQFDQFGTGAGNCGGPNWLSNSLLGFSQTGNQLSIVSFTKNGVDQSLPVDTKVFKKQ